MLNNFLNLDIRDAVGGRVKTGDLFGLELEQEGRNLRPNKAEKRLAGWSVHEDGSLRRNHGDAVEWVFKKPLSFDASKKAVSNLFSFLRDNEAALVCSNRTSTHVHFNMSDKAVYQLVNLFFLFTIFEDVLDTYCGEDRRGNLFCLSSRLAEGNLHLLHRALTVHENLHDFTDGVRYSSFNLSAINKFGSVEFRAMRGLDNEDDVLAWLGILNNLCKYGCYEVFNPVDLVVDVSASGPVGLLKKVFGEYADVLIKTVGEDFVNASVYEGVRLVQPLAYLAGNAFEGVRHRGPDFWAGLGEGKAEIEFEDFEVAPEPAPAPRNNPFLRPRGARIEPVMPPPAPIDDAERRRIDEEFRRINALFDRDRLQRNRNGGF